MRRFISSSNLSTGRGGYFLFVLGERANSGTLWSSVPASRQGGDRGDERREGKDETRGDEDMRDEVRDGMRVELSLLTQDFIHCLFYRWPPEGDVTQC